MPLYDFACKACGHLATYLLKHGVQAVCAACGSGDTEKLLAPFVARTEGATAHVHGPGCGHDHASHAPSQAPKAPPLASGASCATDGCGSPRDGGCSSSYTKEVLQKYVP